MIFLQTTLFYYHSFFFNELLKFLRIHGALGMYTQIHLSIHTQIFHKLLPFSMYTHIYIYSIHTHTHTQTHIFMHKIFENTSEFIINIKDIFITLKLSNFATMLIFPFKNQ